MSTRPARTPARPEKPEAGDETSAQVEGRKAAPRRATGARPTAPPATHSPPAPQPAGGAQPEAPAEAHQAAAPQPAESAQHYALFTVKLLLGENGGVQRTIVTHLPTESDGEVARQWAGWDGPRLAEFMVERVGLRERRGPPAPRAIPPAPGTLIRGSLEARAPGSPQRQLALPSGRPFAIHMSLDLREAAARLGLPLLYSAEAAAWAFDEQRRAPLGTAEGEAPRATTANMDFMAGPLPPGLYRLEAMVRLRRPGGAAGELTEVAEERVGGGVLELH